jgi:hypothetical protein
MKPLPRIVVFLLASTSIASLLGEMYRLWPMHFFTFAVFAPASGALIAFALYDRWCGDGRAYRMIFIGAIAGLMAAVAYDIFRLPFVFSTRWGLAGVIPSLPLFKVFPLFGAMILGKADGSSLAVNVTGWLYHFSNGVTAYPATFGIRVTATFVAVTLAAHLIFGITMGLTSVGLEKWMARC